MGNLGKNLMDRKVMCAECDWRGTEMQVDYVEDPRPLPGAKPDRWQICPKCRSAEHIVLACDWDDCWRNATCGIPTSTGYRHVCGSHYSVLVKSEKK